MTELRFPDPPLRVGEVAVRPWRESDVPDIVHGCSDPLVPRFIPTVPSPYTAEDARNWLADQEPNRREGRLLEMAIADAATDQALGAIAAHMNCTMLSANIGYWLAPQARGRGYATVATRLVCNWLFETWGLGRIGLTTDPDNLASQRVAQRCGFQREGLLRAHEFFRQTGLRRDCIVWGLLPGELR